MPKLKMTIFVIRNCYPDETVPEPIKPREFWVELKVPTNGATHIRAHMGSKAGLMHGHVRGLLATTRPVFA